MTIDRPQSRNASHHQKSKKETVLATPESAMNSRDDLMNGPLYKVLQSLHAPEEEARNAAMSVARTTSEALKIQGTLKAHTLLLGMGVTVLLGIFALFWRQNVALAEMTKGLTEMSATISVQQGQLERHEVLLTEIRDELRRRP